MAKLYQKFLRNPTDNRLVQHVMERRRCCLVPDFPLGVVKSLSQGLRDYHVHENFSELVLVTSGAGVHEVNGLSYPISSGDIFLVQGDLCHCYSEGYGLSIWNVIFCWEELPLPKLDVGQIAAFQNLFVIDPVNEDPGRFDRRFRMNHDDFNLILRKVQELEMLLRTQPAGVQFLAISKFMEIIAFLLSAYERTIDDTVASTIPHRLATLVAMLERSYAEPISIENMCKAAGMSYASLFRHFRKYYDDTPLNYLLDQRLQHAGELLKQQPGLPVSEVAFRCGFTDSAYFSRKFREHFNMPPSRWRRSKMEN